MEELKENSKRTPLTCNIGAESDWNNGFVIDKIHHEAEADDAAAELFVDPQEFAEKRNQLYNVKSLPCDDPTIKCRIEEAERTIKTLTRKQSEIMKIKEDKESERKRLIKKLKHGDVCLLRLKNCEVRYKDRLDTLKLALDKLSFVNKAYQVKSVKSCILEEEINFRNLHFGMLHKSNNLAAEKRLLRETKGRQQSGPTDHCSALSKLNNSITGLSSQTYSERYDSGTCCLFFDDVTHKKCLEEMKPLKCKREEAIANAAVKGPIWNSLGSKEEIIKEMNGLIEKELKGINEDCVWYKKENMEAKKQMRTVEKQIDLLQKKCEEVKRRRDQAYKRILKLQKEKETKMQKIHCA